MTFILSCATEDAVYQVSDRRLTWVGGPTPGGIKDDESNKAVLIDGRMAFGYTGIADIQGSRTDHWLAKLFANVPTSDLAAVAERARANATQVFSEMKVPDRRWLRHAFVGVGWGTYRGETTLEPILVTISNALNAASEWEDMPAADFRLTLNQWGAVQAKFAIASAGQTISGMEKKSIWRHVRRVVRRGAPHRAMLCALIDACLWIANRHASVGQSLMTICIPKSAAIRQAQTGTVLAISGAPGDDYPTFFYRPSNRGNLIRYGPHCAMNGSVVTDFSVIPL